MTSPSSLSQPHNSVHLQSIPDVSSIPFDAEILIEMDFVREICSAISSIRKKNNIKARQPLGKATILGKVNLGSEMLKIIEDECNCKKIDVLEDFSTVNTKTVINLDAKAIAKRIGKDFQAVLKSAKEGIYKQDGEDIIICGHKISKNEFEINLKVEGDAENYTSIGGKFLIILDLTITKTLEMEGIARDFIRTAQNARKEMDLELSQEISLVCHFAEESIEKEAILENIANIQAQILAKSFEISKQKQGFEFSKATSFGINF